MQKKRLAVEDLRQGMYVVELDRPWLGTPFDFQGFPLTSAAEHELLKRYCKYVYIDVESEWRDQPPTRATGASSVRGTTIYTETAPIEKELEVAKEIYAACEETVHKSIESVRADGELHVKPLNDAVQSMTRSIERNPDAMMLLHRIKQKGSYELNRAVDTSVLMITFGRFLQYSSERLELLGLAGLLLDIGKVRLPDAILKKDGALTDEEHELLKAHVTHSLDLVRRASGLPKELAAIVASHHERQDGSGYPSGLSGAGIPLDGAIAGLVDSYSALTSMRIYAEQETPSNALNLLFQQKGRLFHDAVVEQFIQCIGIYPVGSAVELNTGEVAIVVAQNVVRRLQPRVMVILDRDWKPIQIPMMLDLVKEPKAAPDEPYRIQRSVARNKLPVDPRVFFF